MRGYDAVPCYIGRVCDEQCLTALLKKGEFAICENKVNEPLSPTVLGDLRDQKVHGHREFKALFECLVGALVLFVGSTKWDSPGISGATVIGFGITGSSKGQRPYIYRNGEDWDHRLVFQHHAIWTKE